MYGVWHGEVWLASPRPWASKELWHPKATKKLSRASAAAVRAEDWSRSPASRHMMMPRVAPTMLPTGRAQPRLEGELRSPLEGCGQ